MKIQAIKANYLNPRHAKEIQELLNIYACDPMALSKPLDKAVKEKIVNELSKLP